MAYKTKFLHFKTKASYTAERNKTTKGTDERKVFDAYISFIDEGPTICTWGKEYKCDEVVGSLTIDGTVYNGSSNVTVNTKLLQGNNAGSIIKAGYSYSGCNSSITSISGFSYNNPDAVVASSTKITSFPSNVRKMANIANLSGTYYVYCFSYIGGYVYVNGAVYA